MHGNRFDAFVRSVTAGRSRRDALRLLTTSVAAGVGVVQVREAAAQCVENGERCDPKVIPNDCCSGRCSRKRKKCRPAFNQGTCTVEDNVCTSSGTVVCGLWTDPRSHPPTGRRGAERHGSRRAQARCSARAVAASIIS